MMKIAMQRVIIDVIQLDVIPSKTACFENSGRPGYCYRDILCETYGCTPGTQS